MVTTLIVIGGNVFNAGKETDLLCTLVQPVREELTINATLVIRVLSYIQIQKVNV